MPECIPREIDHNGTKIINAYERYTIEIPDREVKVKHLNQVRYRTRVKEDPEPGLILK